MPRINVLSKHVAELIAAGEVVDRPASVAKEMLENSIDAHATQITIEIKNGGISYLRITDNGCGILREDIRNAFVSHATSKVLNEDDLSSIGTLGFRGEALSSICAVAKVEVMTCADEEQIGTRFCIEGGVEKILDDAGCPQGTTMIVRDLFYNTPARMKFLKKDVSEANAVASVVDKIALSHPEISIRFIREGKEVLLTPGNGDLLQTIYAVYGKEFSDSLIEVGYELGGVKISGYISKPISARPNRNMQNFFLNGRFVKTRTAMAAIEEACKGSVMIGKFPSCVINIEVSFQTVDVNVHPSKLEVRFADEKRIFDAVYYAVKSALQNRDVRVQADMNKLNRTPVMTSSNVISGNQLKLSNEPTLQVKEKPVLNTVNYSNTLHEDTKPSFIKVPDTREEKKISREEIEASMKVYETLEVEKAPEKVMTIEENIVDKKPEPVIEVKVEPVLEEKKVCDDFRIVGEAFKTYIIVEVDNKLLLVDKHAAHERMIYNDLKKRNRELEPQMLLQPVTVTLSKEEYSATIESLDLFTEAGFTVEDFGNGTVIVRECPIELENEDIGSIVQELAGYLVSSRELIAEKIDWIYHSTACRAAIKAGNKTTMYEMEKFVQKLLSDDDIRYCPHGRPVLIEMKKSDIEKQFGRIQ